MICTMMLPITKSSSPSPYLRLILSLWQLRLHRLMVLPFYVYEALAEGFHARAAMLSGHESLFVRKQWLCAVNYVHSST